LQANLRQVRTNIGIPLLKVPKKQLLLPGPEKADIPWHTSRVFEHLGPEPKAKRLQMLLPAALSCIVLRSSGDITALHPHSEFLSQMSALMD
jgi:hypothetical protein